MASHTKYQSKELKIHKIERDLTGFGNSERVEQIRFYPENDQIEYIGWKPREKITKTRKKAGFEDETEVKKPMKVEDLPDNVLQVAAEKSNHDVLPVNMTFTMWDQAEDEDAEGEDRHFYILGSQIEDLSVLTEPEDGRKEDTDGETEEAATEVNGGASNKGEVF